jgi:Lysozyme inhibitor LprI
MSRGRLVRFKIFALTLFVAPLPVAAQSLPTERELREECSAFSQAGMRECLGKKAQQSTATLLVAETGLRSRIARSGEDARFKTAALTRLVASNAAFARYRVAACDFQSSLGGGAIGNALLIRRLACIAELNLRRAELLDRMGLDIP